MAAYLLSVIVGGLQKIKNPIYEEWKQYSPGSLQLQQSTKCEPPILNNVSYNQSTSSLLLI